MQLYQNTNTQLNLNEIPLSGQRKFSLNEINKIKDYYPRKKDNT